MSHVFINYRTGNSDETAVLLRRELGRRFGDQQIFCAAVDLPAGQPFPAELRRALRRSEVLLVVIGPDWSTDPRLRERDDWVRQEIRLALGNGMAVLPVLVGRRTERLRAADLPRDIAVVAEHNSVVYDTHSDSDDIRRLGDALVDLDPELGGFDTQPAEGEVEGGVPPLTAGTSSIGGDVRNSSVMQTGNIHGNNGAIVNGPIKGQLHTGRGDVHVHGLPDGRREGRR
ncbi:hypothetical protein BIV57_19985 [Mangrovactinospora gilvigrisea]|uniref:TIR domain-containing protein n=1 Tax=Mangrovactinospora gilvigrisea TaxID=1428644 RepID=A0A1J7BAS4_9ACTN|nr:toll/interleukin-1 receptor domain-containing protein [Mangrovactinospora gilvigrisea]OIV35755.1 hypothetical protein BIV57_19985 [Mangrovactinospora gilvigrisea]